MMIAAALFGNLAADVVSHDDITELDAFLADWFHSHKHSIWTDPMLFITHTHDVLGVCIMASALGLFFYLKKARYWLICLMLAVPGGQLLNVLLKYIFQRARPSFEEPLLTLSTYSFPSGHTLGATVFYGVLAAYLVCTLPRWNARILAVLFACTMVGLVALSRVYLGAHYLSDVLGAIVEGCGWLAVCITGCSTLRRRRDARIGE
ncbi:phosphatase PAP2 family protein [Massilia atriviolacea]|uniref:Phosphatase PAP2 family protein n=2 Tax=Massilia atriviolacea TaxID=2495579 RepID=A0A430HIZ9_9BURK|nr:phosphatase PAP2 family protein [Massilia atriviolacea]